MGYLWPCDNIMRSQLCSKVLLASFAIWFIVLIFAAKHLSSLKSNSNEEESGKEDVDLRIEAASNKLKVLQYEIMSMKDLLKGIKNAKDKESLDRVLENVEKFIEGRLQFDLYAPDYKYETLRKKIINDVREFWFFISSQFDDMKEETTGLSPDLAAKIEKMLKTAIQHKESLTKDVSLLSVFDGFNSWRKTEAESLAFEVQERLKNLQNPEDCFTAKKLICNLNKGCGFGCQIHHAAYCLIVAYATKRTLILTSKGWRYHKNGWEDFFLPLSNTCLSPSSTSRVTWPGKSDSPNIVLPIIDTVAPRPDYLPPAIPKDLAPRLTKLHNQPLVWWIGQMLRYLMRPQPSTTEFFNYSKRKLKFKNPIVGVHVRRTDKIGTEAAFHPIEEYMKHVDAWYDQQIHNGLQVTKRSIYLATDDPRVIYETKEKYPQYEVLGDPDIAKTAATATRYSDNSLNGIILDIHFLSLSDHIVCTFSSQVCRVAYEIMQTYNVDASDHFTSLDDVYYFGGQNSHSSVAILPHVAEAPGELNMMVGDKISVAGNHWNGYSKGRNLRTNQIGLYPSFKVESRPKIVDFP